MHVLCLNTILVLMAAAPVADVYVRTWNDDSAWRMTGDVDTVVDMKFVNTTCGCRVLSI